MFQIDIWSDYACPYCFIGKQQLKQALDEMNIDDYVIHHHVYLLDPGKARHPERHLIDSFAKTPADRANVMKKFKEIEDMALAVGLDYHMENILDVPTEDAHRLTLWAEDKCGSKAAGQLNDRLFRAYFINGEDVSAPDYLAACANECGLDGAEAGRILADAGAYRDKMIEDFVLADEKEIDLVPHYVFNDRVEIMGIMNVPFIKKHIAEALEPLA